MRQGWSVDRRDSGDGRTAVLDIEGEDARLRLETFAGTHRVQRVPANDKRGRRHTSTATVAVLASASALSTVTLRDKDLRIDRMRGSGTGGQRRNKVETAVRLTHLPSGIVITRLSGRSQAANIESAKAELTERLTSASAGKQARERDAQRSEFTDSERSGKRFTHCWYRDEVTDHATNRRWTVRQWKQGRL